MRKFIIKHWAYQYDSKVFGKKFRHPRIANTIVLLLCIGGLINLLIPAFTIFQALVLLPPFILFFGGSKLFVGDIDYYELDSEQKLQYLQQKQMKETLTTSEIEDLNTFTTLHDVTYDGKEKFVNAKRFFFPLIIIAITLIIYGAFGFNEAGFVTQRFF